MFLVEAHRVRLNVFTFKRTVRESSSVVMHIFGFVFELTKSFFGFRIFTDFSGSLNVLDNWKIIEIL
jgi:hypothetical protein